MENNKTPLAIGNKVERIAKDYTGGRKGLVIEIDTEKGRGRVHWTEESDGSKMSLRTWVRFRDLKRIPKQDRPPRTEPDLMAGFPYNTDDLGGTGHGEDSYSDADPWL